MSDGAYERVSAWRTAHGLDAAGRVAQRLAELGIDEHGLLMAYAEPSAALTARVAQPAWAEFVEQAVDAAPQDYDQVGTVETTSWQTSLSAVFRPFTTMACRAVADRTSGVLPPDTIRAGAVADAITAQLNARLIALSVRTLVLNLNRDRLAGLLTGDTSTDRFTDFAKRMCVGERLAELFIEFPVLARLIGQACLQAVESLCELLRRFATDRAEIAADLGGGELGVLVGIDGRIGDAHQGGRSVAMLRFADHKTIVYKPRPLTLHARFTELVRWLNDQVPDLRLRTVNAVIRPDYGWLEFVEHRPCQDLVEVNRFYRRQGALLALLYAVDGTDVHCENLISCGDQVLLVDLETIMHPTLGAPDPDDDPAATALGRSVRQTALLPQMLLGEHGALDISGLGGDKGAPYPDDSVRWAAAGTDEMRLTRVPTEFPGSLNRPRLNGREMDPVRHKAALLAGFRVGYRAIVSAREELIGPAGLLNATSADVVRVLARPTRLYATLLDESTHPSLLRDALDRDRAFDLLWADAPADSPLSLLVRAEITDLWAGDVPLLTARPGARDIWTSDGHRLRDVLAEPSLESVSTKIAAMDLVDLREQEWLISAALATRSPTVTHHSESTLDQMTPVSALDRQQLVAIACGIADQVAAHATRGTGRANWLGLELVEDKHWQVLPMGAGLGEGYSGVAVFLAQLARLTGLSRYHDLATAAIQAVPHLLRALRANPALPAAAGSGGQLGLGGFCYALARLATLLDDATILDWLDSALAIMPTAHPDHPPGLATGTAGGLLAMQSVYTQTGLTAACDLANGYADTLLTAHDPAGEVGFFRGHAGVAWALRRYGEATGRAECVTASQAVLHCAAEPNRANLGWCSGLAGQALADAGSDSWLRSLSDGAPLRDMSLCHGEMGIIETLAVLAGRDERAARVHARRAGQLVTAIEQLGTSCGTPDGVASAGLLTGLSGIGYGLLRLSCTEIPSLLWCEPSVFN